MDEHSPARKKVYTNTRVDWEKRDSDIRQQVQELVEQMKNSEDKPIRICVSNIGKELGIRALLERHMDKLPKTEAYIQTIVESDMDFRLRRIEWAINEMKEKGDNLIEWRILKKAGIRAEYMNELHDIIGQILAIKI